MTGPYVIVSLSGGKDSTAMLLKMIENKERIDEVLTCDTGMEFPQMYEHLEKLYKIIKENGIKLTILKNTQSFEYLLKDVPIHSDKWGDHNGYGWPSVTVRWCTKHLKLKLIDDYLKEIKKHTDIIQCVGLAYDELERANRDNNKNNRHPLIEWKMTEKQCLEYCYSRGFDWGGLYEIFNRVSCWCCPLAPISELKKLWWHYPDLWHKLELWEIELSTIPNIGKRGKYQFKDNLSVFDLGLRFSKEMNKEYYNQKLRLKQCKIMEY